MTWTPCFYGAPVFTRMVVECRLFAKLADRQAVTSSSSSSFGPLGLLNSIQVDRFSNHKRLEYPSAESYHQKPIVIFFFFFYFFILIS
jgi:hypothetical protein